MLLINYRVREERGKRAEPWILSGTPEGMKYKINIMWSKVILATGCTIN